MGSLKSEKSLGVHRVLMYKCAGVPPIHIFFSSRTVFYLLAKSNNSLVAQEESYRKSKGSSRQELISESHFPIP